MLKAGSATDGPVAERYLVPCPYDSAQTFSSLLSCLLKLLNYCEPGELDRRFPDGRDIVVR
jgi:hypothetical protein